MNGQQVIDSNTTTNSIYTRRDHNLVRGNADAVAIDSRKVYGQPDLAGEVSADANAPLRNPNFYGWVYNGGLFAGNAPQPSGDQSGTARVQLYLSGLPTFVNVVWQDMVLCYLGSSGTFTADPSYSYSIPSPSDPNLGVASSQATWANAWNLATATPEQTLSLSSFSSGQYLNFQGTALAPKMILSLSSEATDLTNGTADWRYFASTAYASASGLITSADAQPRAWILDQTVAEN